MAKEVKVLGSWSCPFTYQVELALKLKGVPCDRVEQDIWKKSPLILKSNPLIPVFKKDIPVLVHNGKPIAESLTILEYIQDNWDGYPLFPKDPQEKAYARLLANFISEKIACWCEGEEQKKCIEQTKENLKILEEELKGKKLFGGDAIGLVDIVASIAFWTGVIEKVNGVYLINEDNHSNLLTWSQELLSSDVVDESFT